MPGSKISSDLENDCFAVSFIPMELRREHKEDYIRVGKSKAEKSLRLDYIERVNKIMCSFGGGFASKGSEKEH